MEFLDFVFESEGVPEMSLETKTDLNEDTLDTMQDLIRINIDSRKGFEEAAEEIEDPSLRNLFLLLAGERDRQAEELQAYVELNHEDPVQDGSFAATVHRAWMKVRDALSSDDTYAVLAEAERGEDQIKSAYEKALKETAGSAMNDVLTQHYTQVKSAHDRIRDLRDAHKE
jgi:uncharacterized protein (TIGR02284 family)